MALRSSSPGFSARSLPISGYIFAAVLCLRLIVLFRLADSPFLLPASGDMHFYHEWAQKILRGEWTDHRAFYGLPLYAYVLAGIYAIVGINPFVPGLLQACLEAGTAAVLFNIARSVFGGRPLLGSADEQAGRSAPGAFQAVDVIGLIAAAGWAFYLPAQSYSVILMPTAWLVFVFWFVVWQLLRRNDAPRARFFFVLGLLIGVTAMGIATILFLIPLAIAAAARPPSSGRHRFGAAARTAVAALLIVGGVALGTSPAWIHNYLIARDPVFLSAHSGVNLWIGNNPAANGYPRFPLGLRAGQTAMLQDSVTGAEAALGRPLRRSEVSAFWSDKARSYIKENPGAWARLVSVKIANFWNSFQYDDISVISSLREHGVTFPGFRFGVVAALGLTGVFFAVPRFPRSRWVLAAILLHMLSLLSVFVTERYRLAAAPGLLLFAAFAVYELFAAVSNANYRRAAVRVALLIVVALGVSWRRGDAALWALEPYKGGIEALEAGRLDIAERRLTLAHAYVPDNAELNFALGNLRLARGEREAARAFYHRTLELEPRHEGSFNNLGVITLEEEQWEAAALLFRQALEQDANDAKTHYLLAKALFGAGSFDEAESESARAVELSPSQPEFVQLQQEIRAARQQSR